MAKKVRTPGGYLVPAAYVKGLTGAQRTKRLLQLERMRKKGKVLGDLSGDKTPSGKKRKIPESRYTKKFRARFGNG